MHCNGKKLKSNWSKYQKGTFKECEKSAKGVDKNVNKTKLKSKARKMSVHND